MTTITLSDREKSLITPDTAVYMASGEYEPLLTALTGKSIIAFGELDYQPIPWGSSLEIDIDEDPDEYFVEEHTTLVLVLSDGIKIILQTGDPGCDCCGFTVSEGFDIPLNTPLDPIDSTEDNFIRVMSGGHVIISGYNDYPDILRLAMWII